MSKLKLVPQITAQKLYEEDEDFQKFINCLKHTAKQEYDTCIKAKLKDGEEVNVNFRFFTIDFNSREKVYEKLEELGYSADGSFFLYTNDNHALTTGSKKMPLNLKAFEKATKQLEEIANQIGCIYLRFDVYEASED